MEQPDDSRLQTLSALSVFQEWLEREPAQNKIRDVLKVLAAHTRTTVERGGTPPVAHARQLEAWHRDAYGGPAPAEPVTGKWFPATHTRKWWESYDIDRRQFAVEAGVPFIVELLIDKGGGRSNQSTFWLTVVPLPLPEVADMDADDDPEERPAEVTEDGVVRVIYRQEPAQGAWYVRPLLGRPFLMRSFRGLAFILLVATPFLVAALSGFAVVAIVWSKAQTLARWSGSLTFASVIGAYFTLAFRPFWRLPAMRTTLAPEWALSWRQMYGQLRLSHADDQRARFSLVRFYSSCAICRGTLEIRDGGRGWPGRLVGRCSDSPREHVFSFDPVTRTGRLLVER